MKQFKKDLKKSNEATLDLITKLMRIGFTVEKICKDYRYDFAVRKDGRLYTIEFKQDLKAESTGNVVIEKMSRGVSSGVCATKANYMLYEIGEAYYIMKTIDLLQYLLSRSVPTITGGDDNTSVMFIIPLVVFRKLKFVKQILNDTR